MDIVLIKQLCSEEKLRWTNHAFIRLMQRKISIHEIQEAIMEGEIIEFYPDDYPYASCLLLGICINKRILHIVCSINDDDSELWIITAYEPEPSKWSPDFRKRKEV